MTETDEPAADAPSMVERGRRLITTLRRVWANRVVGGGLKIAALLAIGSAATYLFFGLSGAPYWPFARPFETYGEIYVESPEVYTRERLVNDRYDQDYWLRVQLEELNQSTDLFAKTTTDSIDAVTGDQSAGEQKTPGAVEQRPYQVEFELRSAMRDRIRQLILENLLDDRHDLTGNSVYGLKFDTTVIPGTNTYASAKINVTLSYENFKKKKYESYIQYLVKLQANKNGTVSYEDLVKHYDNWRENLQSRLNEYIATTAPPCAVSVKNDSSDVEIRTEQRKISATALEKILSINDRDVRNIGSTNRKASTAGRSNDKTSGEYSDRKVTQILVPPAPWDEYFRIDLDSEIECRQRPKITLKAKKDHIVVIEVGNFETAKNILKLSGDIEQMCIAAEFVANPGSQKSNDDRESYCRKLLSGSNQAGPGGAFDELIKRAVKFRSDWTSGIWKPHKDDYNDNDELSKRVAYGAKAKEFTDSHKKEIFKISLLFNQKLRELSSTSTDIYDIVDNTKLYSRDYKSFEDRLDKLLRGKSLSIEGNKTDSELTDQYILAIPLRGEDRVKYYEMNRLKRDVSENDYKILIRNNKASFRCIVKAFRGCGLHGDRVTLASGLAKFVESISKRDAYAYAAFPKQDVSGVLSASALRFLASHGSSSASIELSSREAMVTPALTGFSNGADAEGDDSINFGWVIEHEGRAKSIQKSQLVLVSVPALLSQFKLMVETQWLDRDGNPIEPPDADDQTEPSEVGSHTRPLTMTVSLPPDYEALDTLAASGAERRGPAIYDERFRNPIIVRACQRNDVVVPGSRLWRSATVTLGGQPANKITVLPNMQGVIAGFDPYFPIPTSYREVAPETVATYGIQFIEEKEKVVEVDLTIWTSEGVAYLEQGTDAVDQLDADSDESENVGLQLNQFAAYLGAQPQTQRKNRAFAIVPLSGRCEISANGDNG